VPQVCNARACIPFFRRARLHANRVRIATGLFAGEKSTRDNISTRESLPLLSSFLSFSLFPFFSLSFFLFSFAAPPRRPIEAIFGIA